MEGLKIVFEGNNFLRLLGGLWVTIRIALISIGFSLILGSLLGAAMRMKNKVVRAICRAYLEIVRIMPQLVWLFIVFFGIVRTLGINLSGETSAIIVYGARLKWATLSEAALKASPFISMNPQLRSDSPSFSLISTLFFRRQYACLSRTLSIFQQE